MNCGSLAVIEPRRRLLAARDNQLVDSMVTRAQQGDGMAFEWLYKTYQQRVYARCLRLTSDPVESEDLTQEVFFQVSRKIGRFRHAARFSTWLYRVTTNQVYMQRRKRRREDASASDRAAGLRKVTARRAGEASNGTLERLIIEGAIDSLAPSYRTVFILHEIEGRTHREIAAISPYSTGCSKSVLNRARRKLREKLTSKRHAGSKAGGKR